MATGLVFALLAAFGFNLSNLLEKRAVEEMQSLSIRRPAHLIAQLVTSRLWLSGFAASAISIVLLVLSYSLTSIAIVQTIFAAGLGVLVVAARMLLHERLTASDYTGLALVLVATALVAASLGASTQPGSGGSRLSVMSTSLVTVVVVAVVFVACRRHFIDEGLTYGLMSGLLYGIASLQVKAASVIVQTHGLYAAIPLILSSPYPYLFVMASLLGLLTFQTGIQRSSVAIVASVTNVLAGMYTVALGMTIFDERSPSNLGLAILRFGGFGLVLIGGFVLAVRRPEVQAQ